MAVYVHRELSCDHGGRGTFTCTNAYHALPQHTAQELRREARQSGWRRRAGLDYCPDHTTPPTEENR